MALISIQLETEMKVRISYDGKDSAELIYYYAKAIAAAVDKSTGHGLGFCAESTRNPKKVNTKDGFSGLKLVFCEQLQQIKGVSLAVAQAVARAYPAPAMLYKGFAQQGKHMLRDVEVCRNGRIGKVGPKISELLYVFHTADDGNMLVE